MLLTLDNVVFAVVFPFHTSPPLPSSRSHVSEPIYCDTSDKNIRPNFQGQLYRVGPEQC
jgi:hypothetical protein